jgi:hypothetical protein
MTIMIGIDPHKATHTAVAFDSEEQVLGEFTLRASKAQTTRLCAWNWAPLALGRRRHEQPYGPPILLRRPVG